MTKRNLQKLPRKVTQIAEADVIAGLHRPEGEPPKQIKIAKIPRKPLLERVLDKIRTLWS